MELLTKAEGENRRNAERKLQIDEGLKVARRVDTLRKTAAEEEAKLRIFREETTQKVVAEIAELVIKRDDLLSAVSTAEERLRIARIPLDEEWKDVALKTTELDERQQAIIQLEESHTVAEKELKGRQKGVEQDKKRASQALKRATERLSSAEAIRESALELQTLALREKRQVDTHKETVEALLTKRETDVAARERDVVNRLESLEDAKKALADRERRLADREGVLARNLIRYGKSSSTRPGN